MDRNMARLCALYSELVYLPWDAIREQEPHSVFISKNDTQALIIPKGAYTIAAFRGTQVTSGFSPTDLASNIWTAKTRWIAGNARVHRGYSRAVLHIAADLRARLHAVGKPYIVTGHSMGGALATLFATISRPAAVYTFGAPRVGDRTFADLVPAETYHIVHANDFAAAYPVTGRWKRGGQFWHLRENGDLERRTWSQWKAMRGALSFEDHDVSRYVGLLCSA